jgi:acetyl-CoA C-acetyltransferase
VGQRLLRRSVVPVKDLNGLTVLDHDEFIRPDTTVEGLGGAQAVVRRRSASRAASTPWRCRSTTGSRRSTTCTTPATPPASSTAPRSCRSATSSRQGRSASPRGPHRRHRRLRRRPDDHAHRPGPGRRKALAKAGLTVDDIDLFEINEAFAAVALRFMKDLGIPHEKTNVNGGAIAMGHPLGATGAMILGTLIDELERRDLRRGLATCASAAAWASPPSSSGSDPC